MSEILRSNDNIKKCVTPRVQEITITEVEVTELICKLQLSTTTLQELASERLTTERDLRKIKEKAIRRELEANVSLYRLRIDF